MFRKRYIALILGILLLITMVFMPVEDVECSKAEDSCSIYSRSIFSKERELETQFKISDIERYRIRSHYHRRHKSYSIDIILKTGKIIYLENRTSSYERAKNIFDSMVNDDNFIQKGSKIKSLFNEY